MMCKAARVGAVQQHVQDFVLRSSRGVARLGHFWDQTPTMERAEDSQCWVICEAQFRWRAVHSMEVGTLGWLMSKLQVKSEMSSGHSNCGPNMTQIAIPASEII